ncbi:MAG: phosphoribosyltransferase family protein [bacterium]|nr:phosphoribosyltransferase family protein [bacterium]
MTKTIIDAVFPRFCVRCRADGELYCAKCKSEEVLTRVKVACGYCGASSMSATTCKECMRPERFISVHHAFYYGNHSVRDLIRAWKYHFDDSAFLELKGLMKREGMIDTLRESGFNAIIPVPLHRVRKNERGFDQAEDLARFLAEELQLPLVYALKRKRSTKAQADMQDHNRKRQMKSSPFVIAGSGSTKQSIHSLGYKRILLIDDVWTTGSTLHAALQALPYGLSYSAFTIARR